MRKFILTLLLALPVYSYGQALTDEVIKKFFVTFEQSTDEAFNYLFASNEWIQRDADGVAQVKSALREYGNLLGSYIGYEKVGEKSLGNSLKIVVCLVKYDRQPLRFVFKFYKPKAEWKIHNFAYDDNIDDDLEEIMKYDYLK